MQWILFRLLSKTWATFLIQHLVTLVLITNNFRIVLRSPAVGWLDTHDFYIAHSWPLYLYFHLFNTDLKSVDS